MIDQLSPTAHITVRWHNLKLHLAVLAFFGMTTVVMTWPLAAHLSTSVIGPFRSDNFEYVWKIYWVKHAVFELHQAPWVVPDIYYPHGYLLAYGEITPLHTFWGLPITLLLGEVTSYNLFLLISTLLTGYFTYLWIVSLTANQAAGLVGGLIFAFCPYRMARVAGHLPLIGTEGLPLFLLGTERFVQNHRPRDALLVGLAYSMSTLSSWYYGMILAILGAVYLLARARPLRSYITARSTWIGGGVLILTTFVLVGPFVIPYLSILRDDIAYVPLQMADFWSAALFDFLLPNVRHPLWGASLQALLPTGANGLPYEFILSWGMGASVLALYGWRWSRGAAAHGLRVLVPVGLVLSLGVTLHLMIGVPATIRVPTEIATAYNSLMGWFSGEVSLLHEPFSLAKESGIALPLPGLFLRWFVPGMGAMRSWGRFSIMVVLGIATLAGLGLDSWYRREVVGMDIPFQAARRRLWLTTGLFAALVLFEFWTGPQVLVPVGPRPVDRWLAQQPGQFAIMQYPIHTALSGDQMLYTRYHGKRVVFGYGTYLPILFQQLYPELASFPDDASLDRLSEWEVRYVLLDTGALPPTAQSAANDIGPDVLAKIVHQPRLRLIATLDQVQVYRLLP